MTKYHFDTNGKDWSTRSSRKLKIKEYIHEEEFDINFCYKKFIIIIIITILSLCILLFPDHFLVKFMMSLLLINS